MAAETLLREVEEKRKKTLDSLDSEYSAKVGEIKNNTEKEKQKIQEAAKKQAEELSQREKTRIAGASKLQAKKLIFDATEKMLESNLESLKQTLSEWANSKDYQELLPKMVKYASRRLGGDIKVACKQSDAAVLKKTGVEVSESDLNIIGGFKAEKIDGSLELDLTLEELLRGHEDGIRRLILGGE